MSTDEAVVISLGIGLLAAMLLVAWSLMLRHRRREIQHREWMAALEKGVPLPDLTSLEAGMGGARTYLRRGLIWLFCGLTLTIFLIGVWLTSDSVPSLDQQIRQARELGYSPDEIREMSKTLRVQFVVNQQKPGFPFGLTLVGLIPASIGIAYLLFYRIEIGQGRQER